MIQFHYHGYSPQAGQHSPEGIGPAVVHAAHCTAYMEGVWLTSVAQVIVLTK